MKNNLKESEEKNNNYIKQINELEQKNIENKKYTEYLEEKLKLILFTNDNLNNLIHMNNNVNENNYSDLINKLKDSFEIINLKKMIKIIN